MGSALIEDEYFNWIINKIFRYDYDGQYNKLFRYLYTTPFYYSIKMDENRYIDGIDLRYRFSLENKISFSYAIEQFEGKLCSILEMLVGLSVRWENIMHDDDIGDRTGEWFRVMISNLGLDSQIDDMFDSHYVEGKIKNFMLRNYDHDGHGSLFPVDGSNVDMRQTEIWYQLCQYINYIDNKGENYNENLC